MHRGSAFAPSQHAVTTSERGSDAALFPGSQTPSAGCQARLGAVRAGSPAQAEGSPPPERGFSWGFSNGPEGLSYPGAPRASATTVVGNPEARAAPGVQGTGAWTAGAPPLRSWTRALPFPARPHLRV